MIISTNWLKKHVDIDMSIDELATLIGARLVEVEETIDISKKYAGIKIVEVKSAEKIEGSDHLTKCMIFDGKDEIQVVCGAPNVRAGMLAVWLAPGTTVPATYNDNPLVLDARKVMGVESNGMLAAVDELDLGADHNGIIEIDPNMAKPGDDFAELFGLDDILLDIENKSLTHRPDCFGMIGFAREVAGIMGKPAGDYLNNPDKNKHFDEVIKQSGFADELKVTIDDAKLCPRYQAVVLDGFSNDKSKYFSEDEAILAKSGMRPISQIVDITNYLMLLTGQPLHAFDYDKLVSVGRAKEAHIIVRAAKKGETLELLNGKTIELNPKDIIITSNNVPVALAGAMGGANTEIDENTKRIVIESATFNLFNLRGTQFRHGIFSEAITRFTKGQPPALTDPVLKESILMLTENCNMKQASNIVDAYPKKIVNKPIEVSVEQVNGVLGSSFTFDDVITTLENVGFKVKLDGDILKITAPWWRTDIHIPEDVIEEVGRLNGYDNIPVVLPTRSYSSATPDEMGNLKSEIRRILSATGANEVLTYSFVSEKLLTNAGQDPKNSYKIINSISPELQYARQSLTPSLLDLVTKNVRDGYDRFALFEINKLYQKKWGLTDEKVPTERDKTALVLTDQKAEGDAYYEAKKMVENLFITLGIKARYTPLLEDNASDIPFEIKRRAKIEEVETGKCLGVIGEFKVGVKNAFKLPPHSAGFELLINVISEFTAIRNLHNDQSKFPNTERDLTVKVGVKTEFAKLEKLISDKLNGRKLFYEIEPVSIYQGDDKSKKNISFRLTFTSYEKTLTGDEITGIMDDIANAIKSELKGEII